MRNPVLKHNGGPFNTTVLALSLCLLVAPTSPSFAESQAYTPAQIETITRQANQGQRDAMFSLAVIYKDGIGVDQNNNRAFNWFKKAADLGHVEATYNVALAYAKGIGVGKNSARAFEGFQKAANLGHPQSQYNLGLSYQLGEGTRANERQAVRWFEMAAKANVIEAKYALGLMTFNGEGVRKDTNRALALVTDAANQGHVPAALTLASFYTLNKENELAIKWFEEVRKQDYEPGLIRYAEAIDNQQIQNAPVQSHVLYEQAYQQQSLVGGHRFAGYLITQSEPQQAKAIEILKNLSAQGYPPAQYLLGFAYFKGLGVFQDEYQAVTLYEQAAKANEREALYALGLLTVEGQFTERNLRRGVRLIDASADLGFVPANLWLARAYLNGEYGLRENEGRAFNFYVAAAKGNSPEAFYEIARSLQIGRGTRKDEASAFKWYVRAADSGYAAAQVEMGRRYLEGDGVNSDVNVALSWYRKAAEQDFAIAQYNLGIAYYEGKYLEKDHVKALKWFLQAANNGQMGAQYNAALMYQKGIGTQPDLPKAYALYEKAGLQGSQPAQYNLAQLYAAGEGIAAPDLIKAYAWAKLAARGRDLLSESLLAKVTDSLESRQLIEAEQYFKAVERQLITNRASDID